MNRPDMTPCEFGCDVCGAIYSTQKGLEQHVNRKTKCVPPGTPQHACKACNLVFEKKDPLTRHLRSKKHRDAVARLAEPSSSTSIDNSNNANHCDNSTNTNNITHNITHNNQSYTLSNPPPEPQRRGEGVRRGEKWWSKAVARGSWEVEEAVTNQHPSSPYGGGSALRYAAYGGLKRS
ncbi:g9187 [Coccomyxa elongata]